MGGFAPVCGSNSFSVLPFPSYSPSYLLLVTVLQTQTLGCLLATVERRVLVYKIVVELWSCGSVSISISVECKHASMQASALSSALVVPGCLSNRSSHLII